MTTLARFSWTLCVLHVVALGGCPSRQQDAGAPGAGRPSGSTRTEPCDPFEAHELPTELETIFAAGKDMTGTIYVVDRPSSGGSDDRVFVSRGDTFFRKRVVGAGSSGDSDFTWQFEHDGKTVRLVVRKQGTKIIGIALAPADQKTFFDQLDETAQQLTPVDPASIANFSVRI